MLEEEHTLTSEDWNQYISLWANPNDLKIATKILNYLGIPSFGHWIAQDYSELQAAYKNPTLTPQTQYGKLVRAYYMRMKRSYSPLMLYRYIYMIVQSKRFEKLSIQHFAYLKFSGEKSFEKAADKMLNQRIKTNAFLQHQPNFGLHEYSIKHMQLLQDQFETYQPDDLTAIAYFKCVVTEDVMKNLCKDLENQKHIDLAESLVSLFFPDHGITTKPKWNRSAAALLFLFRAMMECDIMPMSELHELQSRLAASFLSKKGLPIKLSTLSTASWRYDLAGKEIAEIAKENKTFQSLYILVKRYSAK